MIDICSKTHDTCLLYGRSGQFLRTQKSVRSSPGFQSPRALRARSRRWIARAMAQITVEAANAARTRIRAGRPTSRNSATVRARVDVRSGLIPTRSRGFIPRTHTIAAIRTMLCIARRGPSLHCDSAVRCHTCRGDRAALAQRRCAWPHERAGSRITLRLLDADAPQLEQCRPIPGERAGLLGPIDPEPTTAR